MNFTISYLGISLPKGINYSLAKGVALILSRAPLRVSLAGGGSDLPSYYESDEGEVFSFAIDKYVYIALHKHLPGGFRLKYSVTEEVELIEEIRHPLIREVLQELNARESLEIASFADIPSSGSGLGSSSAFTVALANAVSAFCGKKLTKHELAELACKVEIERCKSPIGKQDQYASAFGNINQFIFKRSGYAEVINTVNPLEDKLFLESCLSLFYLGFGRSASTILSNQSSLIKSSSAARETVQAIKQLVPLAQEAVHKKNSKTLGEVITLGWELKRTLDEGITNHFIEDTLAKAYKLGIYGAKIVGAGGGGFLLVCHEPEKRKKIVSGLPQLYNLEFQISLEGAEIVYQDSENNEV